MNSTELKEHLENLHQELATVSDIDEDSQALLEKIQGDVRFLLSHKDDEAVPHHATVKDRLEEAARHFDASHPNLSTAINTVVNTLNNMGI